MTFVPHTPQERSAMLERIGVGGFEELLGAIPESLRLQRGLEVPPAMGEVELAQRAREVLAGNRWIAPHRVFAGGGVYPHHVPAVVDEIGHRGEFYTAYTPYQPEVSQGMLQCIFEYQSYICLVTGMEVSNASGYDAGTTLADAVQMAKLNFRGKRNKAVFMPRIHPEAREVAGTYNHGIGLELVDLPGGATEDDEARQLKAALSDDVAAVIFQWPDYLGCLNTSLEQLIAAVHEAGALAIVMYYPFAGSILKTPGEMGADIVCGDAQCFGMPMAYGGPLLGFLACTEKLIRLLPGRLIGRTKCERRMEPGSAEFVESDGFVMTLQAREQHIRRDKATSNICTNQALMALRAAIYLGAVGRGGFSQLGGICHENALHAHRRLTELEGVEDAVAGRSFFNEFTLRFPPGKAKAIHDAALNAGMLAGFAPVGDGLTDCLTFAFTEVHHTADIAELIKLIRGVL